MVRHVVRHVVRRMARRLAFGMQRYVAHKLHESGDEGLIRVMIGGRGRDVGVWVGM